VDVQGSFLLIVENQINQVKTLCTGANIEHLYFSDICFSFLKVCKVKVTDKQNFNKPYMIMGGHAEARDASWTHFFSAANCL
jgi:hypothetical protein